MALVLSPTDQDSRNHPRSAVDLTLDKRTDQTSMTLSTGQPYLVNYSVAAAAAVVEEQTEFDVMLTAVGDQKIPVIKKVVRELTQLGLREAKEVADGVPLTVLKAVSKADAAAAVEKLKAVGAMAEAK